MRILMASHGYPPTISGVTLVVRKIARAMVARGHQVTVVTGSDRITSYEAQDEGVRLIRVQSFSNPFWKEGPIPHISRTDLDRIVAEVNPDVLHLNEAALLALQFVRLSQRADLPLLSTCHYVPHFISQYVGGHVAGTFVERAVWGYSVWLYNQCDRVVFATLAHRQEFLSHGLDTPTTIISNGIDTHRYSRQNGQDIDVEQFYNLPPRPRLLFVGRLAKDKEIDVTIQAMRYVINEMDAHLLLVGRGDYQGRLESLVQELHLQDNVRFLGFVPEEDLPALYRSVDLFTISSTCEVQSLPTLQALSTGVPVIAANALALPEIVLDKTDGLLVEPGDEQGMAEAIVRVLTNQEMARAMGQAGMDVASAHSDERTFDKYEELYRTLVEAEQEPMGAFAASR